jgi:acetyl-CoA/propionyl-CoA carboxylase biotin carboxyl carrier protein
MNTRLQVEHPVTELVTGVDLVEQQLLVAAGEPLALLQEQLGPIGHAIEARLYAEDPAAGFLPVTGTVLGYREPRGEGVRVDSGVRAGTEVSTHYDPLLSKVIAHGRDRATAIRRLDRALGEVELLGVATNAAFVRALLAREEVRSGMQDTGLLERVLPELVGDPPEDLLPAAAYAAFVADTAQLGTPAGPWRRVFRDHGEVRIEDAELHHRGRRWSVSGRLLERGVRVTLDGVSRRYGLAFGDDVVYVARDGHQLAAATLRPVRRGAAAAGSLEAPMPGTVLLVRVANGDAVEEGDLLLVLESMKMELEITAPHAGSVEGLELAVGDSVALRQPLVAVVAEPLGLRPRVPCENSPEASSRDAEAAS